MTYLFPVMVILLFSCASGACFIEGEVGKGWFYLLSALINWNVMWLK